MAVKLTLSGRVQGVCCRAYCMQNARVLGIKGSASNLPDGRVRVYLDTDEESLIELYVRALSLNPHDFAFYGSIDGIDEEKPASFQRGDYNF